MGFFDKLFGNNKKENALAKSVEALDSYEVQPPQEHIVETIAKEAKFHNVDPTDHANSHLLESYDGQGKKYYFEEGQTDKLTIDALKNMSRHHIISSIIGSRINQCAEFAQYSPDEDLGYKIVLKDEHAEISDDDKQNIRALNRFLQNCGTHITDYELTFESFIRQLVRDSLIYDQACFEIIKNRKGEVTGFMPVDATTIKKASLSKEEVSKGRRDPNGIRYVQVINNKVVAEYKQDELCFGIRRPRTDIRAKGLGNSELHELYGVLNNLFNAETYNAANFTNGINANGIIAIKSKMNPKLFRSFRREFYQMLNGVGNARRTPLIQLDPEENEGISSINLQASNREMEYDIWINYLIKITCGVYQIDPAEIGFVFGSESQNSSLFGTDPSARVLMGKEKGLRPLVRSLQTWINRYIIDQIDDRYKLVFTGLDSVSLLDKMKLEQHKMTYMTLNEIRNLHDLPELDDGDILASAYTAIKTTVIKEQGILVANEVGTDDEQGLEEAIEDAHEKELELEGEEIQEKNNEIENDVQLEEDDPQLTKKKQNEIGTDTSVLSDNDDTNNLLEKKFEIKQQKCKRSDGKEGEYVLVMETEGGEFREFGHFTEEDARDHIGVIEAVSKVYDRHSDAFESLVRADRTYIAPKEVSEEAKRGLKAIEEYGSEAGTRVGRTRARQLANREPISYETIKRMKAFFDRHEKNKEIAEGKEWYEDNGRVSWLLWGGSSGREWAEKIIEEVEKEDN